MDVLVTVPKSFGLDRWIDEGDAAGERWSGEEWDFYLSGPRPDIKPGERVYIVFNGAVRGYAPLVRIGEGGRDDYSAHTRSGLSWGYSLVRQGGAVAVTIRRFIQGFRGWRYRDWEYADEVPFPNWQDPEACIGFERGAPTPKPAARSGTRVVHVNRDRFDVYVGRKVHNRPDLVPIGWGNPYHGPYNGMTAIQAYRHWLEGQPHLLARLDELKGKVLGCWCAPKGGLPGDLDGHVCHGEVLAALADAFDTLMAPPAPSSDIRVTKVTPVYSGQVYVQRCGTFPTHEHVIEESFGGYRRCILPGCNYAEKPPLRVPGITPAEQRRMDENAAAVARIVREHWGQKGGDQ